jgi:hypothetical protein
MQKKEKNSGKYPEGWLFCFPGTIVLLSDGESAPILPQNLHLIVHFIAIAIRFPILPLFQLQFQALFEFFYQGIFFNYF